MQDSLKVNQNDDGTFTLEWDKEDPQWSFLNGLTSKEIQSMIEAAVKEGLDNDIIDENDDYTLNMLSDWVKESMESPNTPNRCMKPS